VIEPLLRMGGYHDRRGASSASLRILLSSSTPTLRDSMGVSLSLPMWTVLRKRSAPRIDRFNWLSSESFSNLLAFDARLEAPLRSPKLTGGYFFFKRNPSEDSLKPFPC